MIYNERQFKYLQNFEEYKYCCKYDIKNKSCEESLRTEIMESVLNGIYVKVTGKFVGIFTSENGPVFFFDDKQILLNKNDYSINIISKSKEFNLFNLELSGNIIFSIEYQRQKYTDYDAWSSEEDVDFFLWLAKLQKTDRFYKSYSLNNLKNRPKDL